MSECRIFAWRDRRASEIHEMIVQRRVERDRKRKADAALKIKEYAVCAGVSAIFWTLFWIIG